MQLPLERAGDRCEIVCERGLSAVPHLVAIVNLTALAHGVLPLHASAFSWNGTGILATGWAKGGKTEALLLVALVVLLVRAMSTEPPKAGRRERESSTARKA